jgi:hypothetical protein
MAQADPSSARINEHPGIIRPAMRQHVAHAHQLRDAEATSRIAR